MQGFLHAFAILCAVSPINGHPVLSSLSPIEHTVAAAAQAGTHWRGAFINSGHTVHGASRVVGQGITTGVKAFGNVVVDGTKSVGKGVAAAGIGIKSGVGAGINAVRENPGIFIAGAGGIGVGAVIEESVTANRGRD